MTEMLSDDLIFCIMPPVYIFLTQVTMFAYAGVGCVCGGGEVRLNPARKIFCQGIDVLAATGQCCSLAVIHNPFQLWSMSSELSPLILRR